MRTKEEPAPDQITFDFPTGDQDDQADAGAETVEAPSAPPTYRTNVSRDARQRVGSKNGSDSEAQHLDDPAAADTSAAANHGGGASVEQDVNPVIRTVPIHSVHPCPDDSRPPIAASVRARRLKRIIESGQDTTIPVHETDSNSFEIVGLSHDWQLCVEAGLASIRVEVWPRRTRFQQVQALGRGIVGQPKPTPWAKVQLAHSTSVALREELGRDPEIKEVQAQMLIQRGDSWLSRHIRAGTALTTAVRRRAGVTDAEIHIPSFEKLYEAANQPRRIARAAWLYHAGNRSGGVTVGR